ncbi:MAG: TrkH family potassium uptake protein, partial [Oscillospiraceae bacterium]|nr:TrkH family potassium uptake protein [Oscillospiraceae bacterium]
MNYKMIGYLTGQMIRILGMLMLLPLIVSLIYQESASRNAFAVTAVALMITGTLITLKKQENK